ncbi:hypothetical protein, partial [Endozoicomonas acroporae]|uniref:hypothetical protein n=1 Tax=Endozoicomonas acroporae TaxID=1701104 RepID=UPI003D7A5A01
GKSKVASEIDKGYQKITENFLAGAGDDLYKPGSMPHCSFSESGVMSCKNDSGLMNALDRMFPESESCQEMHIDFDIPAWSDVKFDLVFDFCPVTRAEPVLFWFFNALTLFYLFYAFTSVSTGRRTGAV